MSKRLACLVAVLVAGLAAPTFAQDHPRGSATTAVAGKQLTVDYGRPALKGRSLDELLKQLPEDRIWRAGENQVTTISLDGDVMIGGKKLAAGKYSVYVHAGTDQKWDLVLNKDLGMPLGKLWDKAPDNMKNEPWPYLEGYTKSIGSEEVARVPLTPTKPAAPSDLFTIDFKPAGSGSTLTLAWGDQAWQTTVTPAR
jgi:Protein of unknown function (DUF2911)